MAHFWTLLLSMGSIFRFSSVGLAMLNFRVLFISFSISPKNNNKERKGAIERSNPRHNQNSLLTISFINAAKV